MPTLSLTEQKSSTLLDRPEAPLRLAPNDHSGTPIALIESARRTGRLRLLDEVDESDVVIEFPMGEIPRFQTGATRFVRLRSSGYALVR